MENKNNWHFVEDGRIRGPYLTEKEAKDTLKRFQNSFPDGDFEIWQEDNIEGLPTSFQILPE